MSRYLRFTDAVQQNSVKGLMKAVDAAVADNETDIHLLISSGGGSTFWGTTAYSYLRGAPIHLTTHNIGRADSVALAIYLAGDKRLMTSHSTFLLHPNKANFAQGSLERGALEERLHGLAADEAKINDIIADRTGRGEDEVRTATAARQFLRSDAAVAWGLAHAVEDTLFPKGTKVIEVGAAASAVK